MFTILPRISLFNSRIYSKQLSKRLINTKISEIFCNGKWLYSECKDIFGNLALEEWIYRNVDLKNKKILLFWTNYPAVVIGRHQNPWTECHLKQCEEQGVAVVRRNSGGGTVYHDLNNLNLSFISDKKLYNRLNNLILIRNVLYEKFGIESRITEREDLVLSESGHKISGTASKVGAHNSYHHLTLLINVDMNRMRQLIRKESKLIKSKATESIRSKTQNLITVNNQIRLEDVMEEIGDSFSDTQIGPPPEPKEQWMKVWQRSQIIIDSKDFVGVEDIEDTFTSWEWIYGKTPRFTVTQEFCWKNISFSIEIQVFHGVIEKLITTEFKSNLSLEGIKFTKECIDNHLNVFLSKSQTNSSFDRYLCDCIKQCVEQTL